MPSFGERLKHSWNAFFNNKDPTHWYPSYPDSNRDVYYGPGSYIRPDIIRLNGSNERTIINAIYNRIANDISEITINHVKLDDNKRFVEEINSGLNNCLTLDANTDQTGRAFIRDLVISLFDEGCVAVVPTDTSFNPLISDSYQILKLRIARIVQWYPNNVQLEVFNEATGKKELLTLPKKMVAIIENPFYSIMNEPNSVLKRLVRKLNLLDAIDEQSGSGKLDLIIQLPYVIKTEAKRQQAEQRRKDIEAQLSGSKYGIAYTDGTEHITQLNRSVENNLMTQIEYLTSMLYSQLGLTTEIMNGTADEQTMLNYYNRTVEPVLDAIVDEMKRKFLTKTARSQKQSIMYFRDPFKLVPINSIADIADKFTRNEILSSNEVRGLIGFKPVNDVKADELRNKNINQSEEQAGSFAVAKSEEDKNKSLEEIQNGT